MTRMEKQEGGGFGMWSDQTGSRQYLPGKPKSHLLGVFVAGGFGLLSEVKSLAVSRRRARSLGSLLRSVSVLLEVL